MTSQGGYPTTTIKPTKPSTTLSRRQRTSIDERWTILLLTPIHQCLHLLQTSYFSICDHYYHYLSVFSNSYIPFHTYIFLLTIKTIPQFLTRYPYLAWRIFTLPIVEVTPTTSFYPYLSTQHNEFFGPNNSSIDLSWLNSDGNVGSFGPNRNKPQLVPTATTPLRPLHVIPEAEATVRPDQGTKMPQKEQMLELPPLTLLFNAEELSALNDILLYLSIPNIPLREQSVSYLNFMFYAKILGLIPSTATTSYLYLILRSCCINAYKNKNKYNIPVEPLYLYDIPSSIWVSLQFQQLTVKQRDIWTRYDGYISQQENTIKEYNEHQKSNTSYFRRIFSSTSLSKLSLSSFGLHYYWDAQGSIIKDQYNKITTPKYSGVTWPIFSEFLIAFGTSTSSLQLQFQPMLAPIMNNEYKFDHSTAHHASQGVEDEDDDASTSFSSGEDDNIHSTQRDRDPGVIAAAAKLKQEKAAKLKRMVRHNKKMNKHKLLTASIAHNGSPGRADTDPYSLDQHHPDQFSDSSFFSTTSSSSSDDDGPRRAGSPYSTGLGDTSSDGGLLDSDDDEDHGEEGETDHKNLSYKQRIRNRYQLYREHKHERQLARQQIKASLGRGPTSPVPGITAKERQKLNNLYFSNSLYESDNLSKYYTSSVKNVHALQFYHFNNNNYTILSNLSKAIGQRVSNTQQNRYIIERLFDFQRIYNYHYLYHNVPSEAAPVSAVAVLHNLDPFNKDTHTKANDNLFSVDMDLLLQNELQIASQIDPILNKVEPSMSMLPYWYQPPTQPTTAMFLSQHSFLYAPAIYPLYPPHHYYTPQMREKCDLASNNMIIYMCKAFDRSEFVISGRCVLTLDSFIFMPLVSKTIIPYSSIVKVQLVPQSGIAGTLRQNPYLLITYAVPQKDSTISYSSTGHQQSDEFLHALQREPYAIHYKMYIDSDDIYLLFYLLCDLLSIYRIKEVINSSEVDVLKAGGLSYGACVVNTMVKYHELEKDVYRNIFRLINDLKEEERALMAVVKKEVAAMMPKEQSRLATLSAPASFVLNSTTLYSLVYNNGVGTPLAGISLPVSLKGKILTFYEKEKILKDTMLSMKLPSLQHIMQEMHLVQTGQHVHTKDYHAAAALQQVAKPVDPDIVISPVLPSQSLFSPLSPTSSSLINTMGSQQLVHSIGGGTNALKTSVLYYTTTPQLQTSLSSTSYTKRLLNVVLSTVSYDYEAQYLNEIINSHSKLHTATKQAVLPQDNSSHATNNEIYNANMSNITLNINNSLTNAPFFDLLSILNNKKDLRYYSIDYSQPVPNGVLPPLSTTHISSLLQPLLDKFTTLSTQGVRLLDYNSAVLTTNSNNLNIDAFKKVDLTPTHNITTQYMSPTNLLYALTRNPVGVPDIPFSSSDDFKEDLIPTRKQLVTSLPTNVQPPKIKGVDQKRVKQEMVSLLYRDVLNSCTTMISVYYMLLQQHITVQNDLANVSLTSTQPRPQSGEEIPDPDTLAIPTKDPSAQPPSYHITTLLASLSCMRPVLIQPNKENLRGNYKFKQGTVTRLTSSMYEAYDVFYKGKRDATAMMLINFFNNYIIHNFSFKYRQFYGYDLLRNGEICYIGNDCGDTDVNGTPLSALDKLEASERNNIKKLIQQLSHNTQAVLYHHNQNLINVNGSTVSNNGINSTNTSTIVSKRRHSLSLSDPTTASILNVSQLLQTLGTSDSNLIDQPNKTHKPARNGPTSATNTNTNYHQFLSLSTQHYYFNTIPYDLYNHQFLSHLYPYEFSLQHDLDALPTRKSASTSTRNQLFDTPIPYILNIVTPGLLEQRSMDYLQTLYNYKVSYIQSSVKLNNDNDFTENQAKYETTVPVSSMILTNSISKSLKNKYNQDELNKYLHLLISTPSNHTLFMHRLYDISLFEFSSFTNFNIETQYYAYQRNVFDKIRRKEYNQQQSQALLTTKGHIPSTNSQNLPNNTSINSPFTTSAPISSTDFKSQDSQSTPSTTNSPVDLEVVDYFNLIHNIFLPSSTQTDLSSNGAQEAPIGPKNRFQHSFVSQKHQNSDTTNQTSTLTTTSSLTSPRPQIKQQDIAKIREQRSKLMYYKHFSHYSAIPNQFHINSHLNHISTSETHGASLYLLTYPASQPSSLHHLPQTPTLAQAHMTAQQQRLPAYLYHHPKEQLRATTGTEVNDLQLIPRTTGDGVASIIHILESYNLKKFTIKSGIETIMSTKTLVDPIFILFRVLKTIKRWKYPEVTGTIFFILLVLSYLNQLFLIVPIILILSITFLLKQKSQPFWLELYVAPWTEGEVKMLPQYYKMQKKMVTVEIDELPKEDESDDHNNNVQNINQHHNNVNTTANINQQDPSSLTLPRVASSNREKHPHFVTVPLASLLTPEEKYKLIDIDRLKKRQRLRYVFFAVRGCDYWGNALRRYDYHRRREAGDDEDSDGDFTQSQSVLMNPTTPRAAVRVVDDDDLDPRIVDLPSSLRIDTNLTETISSSNHFDSKNETNSASITTGPAHPSSPRMSTEEITSLLNNDADTSPNLSPPVNALTIKTTDQLPTEPCPLMRGDSLSEMNQYTQNNPLKELKQSDYSSTLQAIRPSSASSLGSTFATTPSYSASTQFLSPFVTQNKANLAVGAFPPIGSTVGQKEIQPVNLTELLLQFKPQYTTIATYTASASKQSILHVVSKLTNLSTHINHAFEKASSIQSVLNNINNKFMKIQGLFRWTTPKTTTKLVYALCGAVLALLFLPFPLVFAAVVIDVFTSKWHTPPSFTQRLLLEVELANTHSHYLFVNEDDVAKVFPKKDAENSSGDPKK